MGQQPVGRYEGQFLPMVAVKGKRNSYFCCLALCLLATLTHARNSSAATVAVQVGPSGRLVFAAADGTSKVTINAGDSVQWTWGSSNHSTTSGSPGNPSGIWDSGVQAVGFTFTRVFQTAGTFTYYCSLHGSCCQMTGTVVVNPVTAAPSWTATDLAVGPDNLMRVLWTKADGTVALWVVNNSGTVSVNNTYGPYTGWTASSIAVGGDGKTRMLWNKTDGTTALWQVGVGDQSAGGGVVEVNLTAGPFTNWSAKAIGTAADNKMRVLWAKTDGTCALWQLGSTGSIDVNNSYGPYTGGWVPLSLAVGSDGKMRVLWSNGSGSAATWVVALGDQTAGGGQLESNLSYGPYTGWSPLRTAVGADGATRVLWTKTDGTAAFWLTDSSGNLSVNNSYGPFTGWTVGAMAAGADNKMRALWNKSDKTAALWQLATGDQKSSGGAIEVNLTFGPY